MVKRDRATLRGFFGKGALPSAEHFSDLVESSLNTLDDGFNKTPHDGIQLYTLDNKDALMSLYRGGGNIETTLANWLIKFNEDALENIDVIANPAIPEKRKTVLSLDSHGRVGINNHLPQHTLDINGTLATRSLRGVEEKPVLANGNWYDITDGLQGVQSFALSAAVGIPGTDMRAALRCTAIGIFEKTSSWKQIFSRSRRFKTQHVYYSSFSHRIRIRWCKRGDLYYLQLGTKCDYKYFAEKYHKPVNDGIRVRYHLSSLWQDEDLSGCNEPLSELEKEQIAEQDANSQKEQES